MLRFTVPYKEKYFKLLFDQLHFIQDIKYWESLKFNAYKYNWTIPEGESTIYLGAIFNSGDKKIPKVVIEYNPNKIKITNPLIKQLIYYGLINQTLNIKSFDLAVDYKIDIDNVYMRSTKKQESYIKSDKGKTYYYGKSRYNGYTRVYDKGAELGIQEKITRYEVRYKVNRDIDDLQNMYKEMDTVKLIELYKKNNGYENIKDDTLKALVYAVNNGYDINQLSRKYKTKVKVVLCEKEQNITPKKEKIINCIEQFIINFIKEFNCMNNDVEMKHYNYNMG